VAVKSILLFEDKLGISSGYEPIWQSLLLKTGLIGYEMNRRNSFRSLATKVQLLTKYKNRIAPSFNPDPRGQQIITQWVKTQISLCKPAGIICMDPALTFLMNPNQDQSTLDTLRGGVYEIFKTPTVISLPISAWHTKKKEKDIARMNEGFMDEEEWEEATDSDNELNHIWLEPIVVDYGRFVLHSDLSKLARILERTRNGE